MLVKQISVFIENKKGKLAEITRVLKDHNVDISAISIADTENFGILRMIANNQENAVKCIREAGYPVNTTEVIAIEVPDHPGGLHKVLEILEQRGISIEYLYSFVRAKSEKALILFKVENPETAVETLEGSGVKVLSDREVYEL